MNKKGQALVEFIIILPFLLMVLLALIDYVQINSVKYDLASEFENYVLEDDYKLAKDISITKEGNKYILSKNVDISSPFLVPIIGKEYQVNISRVLNE